MLQSQVELQINKIQIEKNKIEIKEKKKVKSSSPIKHKYKSKLEVITEIPKKHIKFLGQEFEDISQQFSHVLHQTLSNKSINKSINKSSSNNKQISNTTKHLKLRRTYFDESIHD